MQAESEYRWASPDTPFHTGSTASELFALGAFLGGGPLAMMEAQTDRAADMAEGRNIKEHNLSIQARIDVLCKAKSRIDTYRYDIKHGKLREAVKKYEIEAKEEKQGRYDEYWRIHADDRNCLMEKIEALKAQKEESENNRISAAKQKRELESQIADIKTEIEIRNNDIQNRINALVMEQSTLGMFRGRERRRIEEELHTLRYTQPSYQDISQARQELRSRYKSKLDEYQSKIDSEIERTSSIENEINSIENELNRERI